MFPDFYGFLWDQMVMWNRAPNPMRKSMLFIVLHSAEMKSKAWHNNRKVNISVCLKGYQEVDWTQPENGLRTHTQVVWGNQDFKGVTCDIWENKILCVYYHSTKITLTPQQLSFWTQARHLTLHNTDNCKLNVSQRCFRADGDLAV